MPLNPTFAKNIEHVVVLMLENRSFDSLLGRLYTPADPPANHIPQLPRVGGTPFFGLEFVDVSQFTNEAVVDGQTISQAPAGGVRATNSPGHDPGEEFAHVNVQLFGSDPPSGPATMAGFLQDYATVSGLDAEAVRQIMHGYRPPDVPILSALAREYAVSDSWFASVPTQTNANRAFSLAGTSLGLIDNGYYTTAPVKYILDNDKIDTDTIFNVLSRNGLDSPDDWSVFWSEAYPPVITSQPYTRNLFPRLEDAKFDSHFRPLDEFYARARQGALPKLSYVEPKWGGAILGNKVQILGTEYHPPEDIQTGEWFVRSIYEQLVSNADAWAKTLLVILFDEHGGLFDHVPPPPATPPWGTGRPSFPVQYPFNFDRYGVRVPALLVSPWVERSTVFRSPTAVPYDHTSLLSTLLAWLLPNVAPQDWGLGERVLEAPTLDGALTAQSPRLDDIFAPQPSPMYGDPLRYGAPFRLRDPSPNSGAYVTTADSSLTLDLPPVRRNFPTLGLDGPVALEFRLGDGQVQPGSVVQLRTNEMFATGLSSSPEGYLAPLETFLGDWRNATDCYYYQSSDLDNYQQERWIVDPSDGKPLTYGSYVVIKKESTSDHLSPAYDSGGDATGYLSATTPRSNAVWCLEPVPNVPPREVRIEAGVHACADNQPFNVDFAASFYTAPFVLLSLQQGSYGGTFGNLPSAKQITRNNVIIDPGNWGCIVHWIAIGWGPPNSDEYAIAAGNMNIGSGAITFPSGMFDADPVVGLTLVNQKGNTDTYGNAPRITALSPTGAAFDAGNHGCTVSYIAVGPGKPSSDSPLAYGSRHCLSSELFNLAPLARPSSHFPPPRPLLLSLQNQNWAQGAFGNAPAVFAQVDNHTYSINPGNAGCVVNWLFVGAPQPGDSQ